MSLRRTGLAGLIMAAAVSAPAAATASWDAGVDYFIGWGAPHTRAGDIQGYGVFGRWAYSPRWTQTVTIGRLEYDLETPIDAVGLEPDPDDEPADAFTTVNRLQTGLEYRFDTGGRWRPYAGLGLGYYLISADHANGNTNDGGTFRLNVETPDTAGISAAVGSDWVLGEHLRAALELSFAQTFRKYEVRDSVSGRQGTIDPFAPLGITVRILYGR